jgi:hypothetical protein
MCFVPARSALAFANHIMEADKIVSMQPCPYFESKPVTLPTPGGSVTLYAVCCRLAEGMRERLAATPEGRQFVELLTITPHSGEPRFLCGPDMDPITRPTCTQSRRQERCQSASALLPGTLGLDAATPPEK